MNVTHARLGFSLFESLIVLAILAVLLGVGLPGYQKIIERNQRTQMQQCLLATAQKMEEEFLQDFRYPADIPAFNCPGDPTLLTRYGIELRTSHTQDGYLLAIKPRNPRELTFCGWLQLDHLGNREVHDANATSRCW
jgi:type IV pilus assembly protein PilE